MIDLRIMNDLPDDEETAIFENFARGVGEVDRTLNAVTKPKLFRQAHGRVTHANDSTCATHFFDNIAAVMRLDLFLHRSHHIGRAQINFLARRRAAGNKVRAHKIYAAICTAT